MVKCEKEVEMGDLLAPFTDKFKSDWALFLEHWKVYTCICLIALGIALYLRFREYRRGNREKK